MAKESVLIIGAGQGLSASLARLCYDQGMAVSLAARNTDKLADLAKATEAETYSCDVAEPEDVKRLFQDATSATGIPDLVVFNPSARVRGPVTELDPAEVLKAISITCYGGFLVGQQAAQSMLSRGSGTILFTGASASVKGYPNSSAFAMGKFGLRGLAQSMARELHPNNIHVGHFVIDGAIEQPNDPRSMPAPDGFLDPDAVAQSYLQFHRQHRSAWAWEIELRPYVETF